jgi:(p)ppGpp synthase/HD superfamily hydrolase
MEKKLRNQPQFVISEKPPSRMIRPFNKRYQRLRLHRAYDLGFRAHKHEIRKDGRPYFSHPKAVGKIILEEWLVRDVRILIAALLHDTREIKHPRVYVTRKTLSHQFGEAAEADNYALTRKAHDKKRKEAKQLYIERIVLQGWRTLLVKLADRVHNLRTLQYQPEEKWQRIYDESCRYYQPLISVLSGLLPDHFKPTAALVEQSLERALQHANRFIQNSS